jgi:heterodisulfide reductase subunit A-like polyferredoxin
MKKRAGVFVCQCGTNIEATIDTEKVAEYAKTLPGVVYATTYKYMCSDPGQAIVLYHGDEVLGGGTISSVSN